MPGFAATQADKPETRGPTQIAPLLAPVTSEPAVL
jgi:hypothetical protein